MKKWLCSSLAVGALAFAGCGNGLECGKGTVEEDGQCVSTDDTPNNDNTDPSNTTNNGTQNNSNSTNGGSDVSCGPGTELDAMDRCVVVDPTTCGNGTQLDANTGECLPTDQVCGDGTAYDGGSNTCLPTDEVCAAGTTFDTDQGLCLPDAQCQTGDVVVEGFCVSPVEELIDSADLAETENNDPTTGGTAESITLPNVGEQYVIAGAIGEPSDLDGDGLDDQDIDVFEFDATAGQWITVTAQPVQGPPLSFRIEGPDGYERSNFSNVDYGSAREFVTSRDGTYRLFIGPQAHVATPSGDETPVGDAEYEWAATIEVNDPPQPTDTDLTAGEAARLIDLRTNLFSDDAFQAGNVAELQIAFEGFGEAELIFFDGPDVVGSSVTRFDNTANTIVPASGTLTVLVDWIQSDRSTTYELSALDLGTVTDLGTIASGDTVTGSVASLAMPSFFTFELPTGHVAEFSQTNDDGATVTIDATLEGAPSVSGTLQELSSGSGFGRLYRYGIGDLSGGTYLVRVEPPSATANFELSVSAVEPTDLGSLDDGSTVMESDTNTLTRSRAAFLRGTLAGELLARGDLLADGADVDIIAYDANGDPVASSETGGEESFSWLLDAGVKLFRIQAFQELPTGWSLDMTFETIDAVDEMEPNDTIANATAGLTLMDDTRGSTSDGDLDFYSFDVTNAGVFTVTSSPLAATGLGSGLNLQVRNADDETIEQSGSGPGDRTVETFLEPGSYYAVVTGDSPDVADYLVSLERSDSSADLDDAGSNDTAANAQDATLADGYTIAGVLSGSADADWYAFDLANAQTYSFAGGGGLTVTFYDDAMQEIPTSAGLIDLPMGTSYVSVEGFTDGGPNDYVLTATAIAGNIATSEPDAAIPDGGFPGDVLTDTLSVSDPGCMASSVQVLIDITHTWRGDLDVTLESPNGTVVQLWAQTGASADDLNGIFGADLTSAESLDAFQGGMVNGDWILTVGDSFPQDSGTLNSWGLIYECQ